MNKPLGIALVVVGVMLIVFGLNASDSIGSSFSRLFTGKPTDKTIWLLAGGIVSAGVGLFMFVGSGRSAKR